MKIEGTLVNLFMYDVNGELNLEKAAQFISKKYNTKQENLPEYMKIEPKPLYFNLGEQEIVFMNRRTKLRTNIRIYSIGAISIILEIPIKINIRKIYKLRRELKIVVNQKITTLKELSKSIFNDIIAENELVVNPYLETLEIIPEEQQILFVNGKNIRNLDTFVRRNEKEITGYLRYEPQYKIISKDEIASALKYKFRYTNRELAIIDWDAAFIITDKEKDEDYLTTIELANIILLELRTYDRMLDQLISQTREWLLSKGKIGSHVIENALKNMARIQLGFRVTIDNLENPTKFFEDLPIARLYKMVAERLFLADWEKSVEEKLSEMSSIYQFYHTATEMARANLLEWGIIILFILDIILIVFGI